MNYISQYFTCNAEHRIHLFVLLCSPVQKNNGNKTRTRGSPVDVDKLLSHRQRTGVQIKYGGLRKQRKVSTRGTSELYQDTSEPNVQNSVSFVCLCPVQLLPDGSP